MIAGIVGTHRIKRNLKRPLGLQRSNTVLTNNTPRRTQCLARFQFFLTAQRHPARVPQRFAQLDGGSPDSAGTSMNQYLLTWLGSTQLKYIEPCGTEYFRDRRSISPAQTSRNR